MTELRTQRLTLTKVAAEDAPFVLELLNDAGWVRNIGERNVRSPDQARAYIGERFQAGHWFVARNADLSPVGMCGIVVGREGLNCPDIGYALLERHSGLGYATEAAGAVLRYAREVMGLKEVGAVTSADNLASQRVLEKIGLRFVQLVDLPGYAEPSLLFTT